MIDQEVILITETRKGSIKQLADYYLKKGYFVVGCNRGESSIKSQSYWYHRLDVSDEIAVKAIVQGVYDTYGRLDIVINNAGVASINHAMLTPMSSVEKTIEG